MKAKPVELSSSDIQFGNDFCGETRLDSSKHSNVNSGLLDSESKPNEEAVMGLKNVTNGGKEIAQNSYLGSEVDSTVTNQMVECLHFSERSSSLTENVDCEGDAEVHKIKDTAPMEEDKLIANGRLGVDGEDGSCHNTDKRTMQRREECNSSNTRPPALVIPHSADETVSNNGVYLPASLVSSPSPNGTKALDPNAPEFTPTSPSLCTAFSPRPVFPVGIPPPYMVDTHYPYGTGFEMLIGTSIPDLNGGSGIQSHAGLAPRACYGTPPAPPAFWEGGHGQLPSPRMMGCAPSPLLGPQSHGYPIPRPGTGFQVTDGREPASRSLLLTEVPIEIDNETLHKDLLSWGPIRSLDLQWRSEGIAVVHYYDIRHSQEAFKDIMYQRNRLPPRQKEGQDDGREEERFCKQDVCLKGLIGGKVISAQYSVPTYDGHNHGTLIIFNLDADASFADLRATFENFGPVKELRGVPPKLHKFVEFYDMRDAARALEALDGQEICGKRVKVEFSRSIGQARRGRANGQNANVPSGIRSNTGPYAVPGRPLHWNSEHQGPPSPLGVGAGVGVGVGGHLWGSYGQMAALPLNPEIQQALWYGGSNGQIQSLPYPQPYIPRNPSDHGCITNGKGFSGINGSPCTRADPSVRRRRGIINGNGTGLSVDVPNLLTLGENGALQLNGRTGLTPKSSPRDSCDQYVFDIKEAELKKGSPRTTLMIKNIPNKYSQPMLFALLDHHCIEHNKQIGDSNGVQSAYDFVYLPIDFKNRCNLGYAFVNFTSVEATVRFYKSFHRQLWEAFNSRKICEITYARVQGREAFEEHFHNSRFACDTQKYLPVTFSPPRDGIQCTPPTVIAGLLAGGRNNNNNNINANNSTCCDGNDVVDENSGGDDVNDNDIVINIVSSKQSLEPSER
eukprot:Gb_33381 [translate_table: standard]